MTLATVTTSFGFKRYVSAALSSIIGLVSSVPEAAPFLVMLESVAGVFGITGVLHATGQGTLNKATLASLASLIAFIASLAPFIPQLQPYEEMLRKLAAFLGATALGAVGAATMIARKNG